MKKSAFIVLVLCSQFLLSQVNRFIYQVTFKPDSTNRTDVKSETAYLDISRDKSLFYSEKRLQRDSLVSRMRQTGGASFNRAQMEGLRSDLEFTVAKDYSTGLKTFASRIARDQYAYEEDRPMDWKILTETATIGEYKTQKAETFFGGRTWYAWFSTDIPLQDGPYKFSGLPGLIVKVEDSAGDYAFDLKETKKIATVPEFGQQGNTVKVKRKDFEKQQALYRKDPTSLMQSARAAGRGGNMRTPDPAQRKQMEDRIKEEIKRNNNPIELDR